MTTVFKQRPKSQSFSGTDQTITTNWIGMGFMTRAAADSAAYYGSPMVLEGLYRQPYEGDPQGNGLWYYTIRYGPIQSQAGSWTFSFDTSGSESTIRVSLSTVAKYAPAGKTAPDRKALNVDESGKVQGVSVYVPATRLTYRLRHPKGAVTEAMSRTLTGYTGCVNSAVWHGYGIGTLLFIGAVGSQGTDSEAELSYNLLYSETALSLAVDSITVTEKQGWDYLDIAWQTSTAAAGGDTVDVPTARYAWVQRVYRRIAFGTSFGF